MDNLEATVPSIVKTCTSFVLINIIYTQILLEN